MIMPSGVENAARLPTPSAYSNDVAGERPRDTGRVHRPYLIVVRVAYIHRVRRRIVLNEIWRAEQCRCASAIAPKFAALEELERVTTSRERCYGAVRDRDLPDEAVTSIGDVQRAILSIVGDAERYRSREQNKENHSAAR